MGVEYYKNIVNRFKNNTSFIDMLNTYFQSNRSFTKTKLNPSRALLDIIKSKKQFTILFTGFKIQKQLICQLFMYLFRKYNLFIYKKPY